MVTFVQLETSDADFPAEYRYAVTTETLAKMAIQYGVVIQGARSNYDHPIWIEMDEWSLDKVSGLVDLINRLLNYHSYYAIESKENRNQFVFRKEADNHWVVLSDILPVGDFLETDIKLDSTIDYLNSNGLSIPVKETTLALLALEIQAIGPIYNKYSEEKNGRLYLTRSMPLTLLELVEDLKDFPFGEHYYVQGEIDTVCFIRVSEDLWCCGRVSNMFKPVEINN